MNRNLSIKSAQHTYSVAFVETLEALLQELAPIENSLTIVDRQIENAYFSLIQQVRHFSKVLIIDAKEENKTLQGCELVLKFFHEHNATKSSTIIAIGGGITQEIASFAAHVYYRGLACIFVPTTLLAMSDSCIGGKCSLNYDGYKNQLGAFHSPKKVFIWTGFTETLSDDAMYSGYGEIFKLMLIGNQALYTSLCHTIQQKGFRNNFLADHIFKALEIKKTFIEEDEFDTGVRRILNYGHTFGHAIELVTHYEISHGIAVVYGLDIANYIAYRKGLLNENLYLDIHNFIKMNFPRLLDARIQVETLLTGVQRDKKCIQGKLNMVFLKNFGNLIVESILSSDNLKNILTNYFDEEVLLTKNC